MNSNSSPSSSFPRHNVIDVDNLLHLPSDASDFSDEEETTANTCKASDGDIGCIHSKRSPDQQTIDLNPYCTVDSSLQQASINPNSQYIAISTLQQASIKPKPNPHGLLNFFRQQASIKRSLYPISYPHDLEDSPLQQASVKPNPSPKFNTVLTHLIHYFDIGRPFPRFIVSKRRQLLLLFSFCVLYLLVGKMAFISLLFDLNTYTPKVRNIFLSFVT